MLSVVQRQPGERCLRDSGRILGGGLEFSGQRPRDRSFDVLDIIISGEGCFVDVLDNIVSGDHCFLDVLVDIVSATAASSTRSSPTNSIHEHQCTDF